MTETETKVEAPDLTTPGDDATPQSAKAKHPARGRSYRVMGDGDGDVCIYQIAPSDSDFPKNSLIPIPEIPRFDTTAKAMRWISMESGDLLAGKQVMVFKAMEILRVNTLQKPQVVIEKKPKVQVGGVPVEAEG